MFSGLSQYTQRPLLLRCGGSVVWFRGNPRNPQKLQVIFMSDKRTKSVKIRLNESEFEQLNASKDRPELAVWMRETCLGVKPKRKRTEPLTVDPLLLRQLAAIGNNLNQLARLANSKGMSAIDSVGVIAALQDIKTELEQVRSDHAG